MFELEVISPTDIIFSGEVRSLNFTSIGGETTILANHMPFATILDTGEVHLQTDDKTRSYTIGKGVFSINGNKAALLIEDVTASDELSEERAKDAIAKAQEIIAKGVSGPDLEKALYSVRRSTVDLRHLQKRKRKTTFTA